MFSKVDNSGGGSHSPSDNPPQFFDIYGSDYMIQIRTAVLEGDLTVLRVLASDLGPALFSTDESGVFVLHLAAFGGHSEIIRWLFKEFNGKFDVNSKDQNGTTALMIAAKNGHEEVANVLVEESANVLLLDNNGKNALDYALEQANERVVELLLHAIAPSRSPRGDHGAVHVLEKEFGHLGVTSSDVPLERSGELLRLELQVSALQKELIHSKRALAEQEALVSSLEDRLFCVVCMEHVSDTVFLECAHMVTCYTCAVSIKERGKCPVCQRDVTRLIRTFRS